MSDIDQTIKSLREFSDTRPDGFSTILLDPPWRFINRTGMTHPMHIHLDFFQVLDRQNFTIVDGELVPSGSPTPPAPSEAGWKDTVQVAPMEMVRVITRFADYTGRFPYHCHILEHEDHEMMRQFQTISCGNGDLEPTEECDDGNTTPGDGCDASCHTEVTGCPSDIDCDGVLDSVFGDFNACNSEVGTQLPEVIQHKSLGATNVQHTGILSQFVVVAKPIYGSLPKSRMIGETPVSK